MAQIVEWMAVTPTRLLTISGPGGSGKTHLAINAAHKAVNELIGPYHDGIFYLALVGHGPERLVSAEDLLIALAQTLQLELAPREAPATQLGRYLHERELLLIIDNGELLTAEARTTLSTLLAAAPALRLIIPSRERLKLREEYLLELDGLPYPDAASLAGATPPDPGAYAAGQLLLQRAGHTAATVANQRALGEICRLVHGLPLALELAAPWLTLRSPQELYEAIAATIDVLQSDAPDLPERQRSIRAVFEYSWRLLTEAEAEALAGLSVFPADFNAAAAEQIVGAGLAALGALRDKSLLQVRPGATETRYALHPLLQRFALDKLQADGSTFAALCKRHAGYFAAIAEAQKPLLYGAESAAAIAAIEREFANIRSGWTWATQQRDIAMLGAYSIPLHDFMALRGWNVESLHLFGAGAAAVRAWTTTNSSDAATTPAAVRVLSCYAELQQIMGDPAQAERAYHDCRVLLNAIAAEDTPELLFVYKQIGLLAYGRGAYSEALQYLRLTLAIAEEGADKVRVADTLLSIGAVLIAQGAWPAAEQTLRRALALYDDLHYAWGRGHALRFLGTLALHTENYATAAEQLQAALAASRAIDNRIGVALSLDQLGLLYLAEERFEASAAAFHEALELFQSSGVDLGSGRALIHLARLAAAQGQVEQARQRLGQALLIAERLPSPPLLLECAAAILALHRQEHTSLPPELIALAAALSRHPAAAADTQRQLAALAGGATSTEPMPTLDDLAPLLQTLLRAGAVV
jgi:predicted ATPase